MVACQGFLLFLDLAFSDYLLGNDYTYPFSMMSHGFFQPLIHAVADEGISFIMLIFGD